MYSIVIVPAILAVIAIPAQANELEDKQLSFSVQHSFDAGPDITYTPRATVSVPLTHTGDSVLQQAPLHPAEIAKLAKHAENNGLYRVRVTDLHSEGSSVEVSSFMKACSLYESELTDQLTLMLDRSGALLGVSIFSSHQCQGARVPEHRLSNFNTTFSVSVVNIAPAPDTQTYVRRLEQEKAEKARGENADNRSFFAKYWMYIMPLLIFLLISGASNPEGQGSGGSGR